MQHGHGWKWWREASAAISGGCGSYTAAHAHIQKMLNTTEEASRSTWVRGPLNRDASPLGFFFLSLFSGVVL